MMPLSEISNNVSRSISNARDKANSEAGSVSTPSLPSRAVQSMLKTSTELGDLGQFAIRPSRLPRSGSRLQSNRPRSGSFDASYASALRHQRPSRVRRPGRHHTPRPVGSSSGMPARNVSQSNLSSYTNVSRRKRYPPGSHPYPLRGVNDPGPGPRGLYHHRSLVTLRSHSSIPSQSPMMRPTLLGRPGYRASSPAYNDMQSMSHTPVPRFMRAPSVGTIGSSPASMFPRHHGMPGYRPDLSASNASLVRLPSPEVSFSRNIPYPVAVPLRTPTPSSIMFHQQQALASNASLAGHLGHPQARRSLSITTILNPSLKKIVSLLPLSKRPHGPRLAWIRQSWRTYPVLPPDTPKHPLAQEKDQHSIRSNCQPVTIVGPVISPRKTSVASYQSVCRVSALRPCRRAVLSW